MSPPQSLKNISLVSAQTSPVCRCRKSVLVLRRLHVQRPALSALYMQGFFFFFFNKETSATKVPWLDGRGMCVLVFWLIFSCSFSCYYLILFSLYPFQTSLENVSLLCPISIGPNKALLEWFSCQLFVCARVPCSPGWSGTCYINKNDLELMVLVHLPSECWNDG